MPTFALYSDLSALDCELHIKHASCSCHGPWTDLRLLPIGAEFHCYTDGSLVQGKASWAFAAYIYVPALGWFFQGVAAAPTSAGAFSEALGDALDGEAAALAAALSWLLALPPFVAAHLHFDCLSAGFGADGSWRIPVDSAGLPRPPFVVARSLYVLHQSLGRPIFVHHVRSHQGDPFNELVDRVAKAAAQFGAPSFTQWRPWADLLASPMCKWLWLFPASWCSHGLPSVWDLAAGTASDFVDLPLSTASRAVSPSEPAGASFIHFECGSLNVCTLRPQEFVDAGGLFVPALQLVLQDQCVNRGYHILGVQETRLPKASTYATEHFLVFNSAAQAGQSGCSLWVSRRIPFAAKDGQFLCLSLNQCHVLVSEPRLLLVRVRAPAVSWLLSVAHAPHSKRPEEEREAWWSRATRVIEGFRHAHELLTVCIDSNARVGCNALPGVGPRGAEQANFESFLEALGLGLPCTLPVHEGPTTTWTSPKGSQSRIDFVAISLPFLSAVKFSVSILILTTSLPLGTTRRFKLWFG